MRDLGYRIEVTERVFPGRPVKYDLYGLGDAQAFDSRRTILVQATTVNGLSAHKKKALASEDLEPWLCGPGREFWLLAWKKVPHKKGSKRLIWKPRLFFACRSTEGPVLVETDQFPEAHW